MTHNKQNNLYKLVTPVWEEPTPPMPTSIWSASKARDKAASDLAMLHAHKAQLKLLQPSDDSNDRKAEDFTLWLEDAEKEIESTQERYWALDHQVRTLAAADLKKFDAIWEPLERNNYRLLKQIYIVAFIAFAVVFATAIPNGLWLYAGIFAFVYVSEILQRQIIKFFWPETSGSIGSGLRTCNAQGPATEELLA
jgi:hypothetical protein